MRLLSQRLAGRPATVLRTRTGPAHHPARVGDAVVYRGSDTFGDTFSLADLEGGEFCIIDEVFCPQLIEAINQIIGLELESCEVGYALVYRSNRTYGDLFSVADRRSSGHLFHCGDEVFLSQLGRALGEAARPTGYESDKA